MSLQVYCRNKVQFAEKVGCFFLFWALGTWCTGVWADDLLEDIPADDLISRVVQEYSEGIEENQKAQKTATTPKSGESEEEKLSISSKKSISKKVEETDAELLPEADDVDEVDNVDKVDSVDKAADVAEAVQEPVEESPAPAVGTLATKDHKEDSKNSKEDNIANTGKVEKSSAKAHSTEKELLLQREDAIVRAIRMARPAVVNIRGEKLLKPTADAVHADESQHVNGMGTGILIHSLGYILTNYHVVDGIQEIHVTTSYGKTYTAEVLERDTETDLAIIRIQPEEGETFETIHLGQSGDLMTGETVIAVGNAFGYEHTVTKGIISAQHRSVQVSDIQYYDDLIQTDASINPGNSGGPLLNIHGEMIGINVAVRAGAQGIGFAIPVDKALKIATRLISGYAARKSWHGIHFASEKTGAKVAEVEKDSPAQNAGIKPGDTIFAVNQREVHSEMDFVQAILSQKAGDCLELKIERNRQKARTSLTLGAVMEAKKLAVTDNSTSPKMASYNAPVASAVTPETQIWEQLGMEVVAVASDSLSQKVAKSYKGGLFVQKVRPGSPVAKQGVQPGDVLLGVLRWETISVSNLVFVLEQNDFQKAEKARFLIARGNAVMFGFLTK